MSSSRKTFLHHARYRYILLIRFKYGVVPKTARSLFIIALDVLVSDVLHKQERVSVYDKRAIGPDMTYLPLFLMSRMIPSEEKQQMRNGMSARSIRNAALRRPPPILTATEKGLQAHFAA